MLKSALLDEVFTWLRICDSFFHHQDDRTLGENDLLSAYLLMFFLVKKHSVSFEM